MQQNLISLSLSDAELGEIDGALDTLERVLSGMKALDARTRQSATKMGGKSEAFVRQTLNVLSQNRQLIPPALDLEEALRDLGTIDATRPRFARLQKLAEKSVDTTLALGSDSMTAAQAGHTLLKQFGKSEGLDGLREGIGARFARGPKKKVPTT